MLPLHKRLFPQTGEHLWLRDLLIDERAKNNFPAGCIEKNPLLDPKFCEIWIAEIQHQASDKAGVMFQWAYGGYLEDRTHALRGTYLPEDKRIHLGIDYHVPANTVVHLPVHATLLQVLRDEDQEGGWGGRLLFVQDEPKVFFVLAHLGHALLPDHLINKTIKAGTPVGLVGHPNEGGGWWPHLHVQCLCATPHWGWLRLEGKMGPGKGFDGYSSNYAAIGKVYPNPEEMLVSV